eukprot:9474557-Pyramimonas_sp.AAC.1
MNYQPLQNHGPLAKPLEDPDQFPELFRVGTKRPPRAAQDRTQHAGDEVRSRDAVNAEPILLYLTWNPLAGFPPARSKKLRR